MHAQACIYLPYVLYMRTYRNKDKLDGELAAISESKQLTKSQTKLEEEISPVVSKSVIRLPGEKDLNLVARLSGIELVLSESYGNLLQANVKGQLHIQCSVFFMLEVHAPNMYFLSWRE